MYLCLRLSLFAGLLGFAFPLYAELESEPAIPVVTSILHVKPVGVLRRSTVNTDAIEYQLAKGIFIPPVEGDKINAPDGSVRIWQTMPAMEHGDYPAIGKGWVHASIDVKEDSIWILNGKGYRHVHVNNERRIGDMYGLGYVSLPIALKKGKNTLLFRGGRGRFQFKFTPAPADVFLEKRDATLPDYVRDVSTNIFAGILITNAADQWQTGFKVRARYADTEVITNVPTLAPLSTFKIPVQLPSFPAGISADELTVKLELVKGKTSTHETLDLNLAVRNANQKHTRTFISEIDGSVQYFGVTPPPDATTDTPKDKKALLLTLHGASVDARRLSDVYTAKANMYIVAPTNRRPFGFDWEDWGRIDALEVLEYASGLFNADPTRTYLSGHSMGGHGTWSIGAYYAGRFAAIAPSAGWRDYWSHGTGGEYDTTTPIGRLLDRTANVSRTMLMKNNYFNYGVYILHGDADKNVPVEQSRYMRSQLADRHKHFAYHEQPEAGHWWGDQTVDWPPIFSMFNKSRIEANPNRVDFTTVDPGISSSYAWVTIEQQIIAREVSRVIAQYDEERHIVTIKDTNIASLSLDLSVFSTQKRPAMPAVQFTNMDTTLTGTYFKRLNDSNWIVADANGLHKTPNRNGPFKDAFRNNMLAVVGTQGTAEENAWALTKARYDAETFWYRGNGSIEIIRDTDFDPEAEPDRTVVLYGNASTNKAWNELLSGSPIRLESGSITIKTHRMPRDDLALLMARPRPGSDTAMVAIVGGSGITGMRLTEQFPFFASGLHYPDWFIAEPEIYLKAEAGVVAAGFFDSNWSIGDDYVTDEN